MPKLRAGGGESTLCPLNKPCYMYVHVHSVAIYNEIITIDYTYIVTIHFMTNHSLKMDEVPFTMIDSPVKP